MMLLSFIEHWLTWSYVQNFFKKIHYLILIHNIIKVLSDFPSMPSRKREYVSVCVCIGVGGRKAKKETQGKVRFHKLKTKTNVQKGI